MEMGWMPNVYSFFFFVIKEMNLKTELPLARQNKDILFMIYLWSDSIKEALWIVMN